MDKEFTYKYEITIHNKEDVAELFNVVERFKEGSCGSIKPLDSKSFEIVTEVLEIDDKE